MLTNKWRNIFFNLQSWQSESGFSSEQIAILKHSKIICKTLKKTELLKIVMLRKINKWHQTKKNFQFFLFVYWLFISSWETLKPDFQAILCNYGNPERLVFKWKPSFSRRNMTPGTGTLRKRANATVFEIALLTFDFPTGQKSHGPWQTKTMVHCSH